MVYKVATRPYWVEERLKVIDRAGVSTIEILRHSNADSTPVDLTQRAHHPRSNERCLPGYDTVQSGKSLVTFQRALLPPSTRYFTISYCND
jgi:hypothetical protein